MPALRRLFSGGSYLGAMLVESATRLIRCFTYFFLSRLSAF